MPRQLHAWRQCHVEFPRRQPIGQPAGMIERQLRVSNTLGKPAHQRHGI
jgi:hypothetical protein